MWVDSAKFMRAERAASGENHRPCHGVIGVMRSASTSRQQHSRAPRLRGVVRLLMALSLSFQGSAVVAEAEVVDSFHEQIESKQNQLLDHAERGDHWGVAALLTEAANAQRAGNVGRGHVGKLVNYQRSSSGGQTALILAASKGHVAVIKVLLGHGVAHRVAEFCVNTKLFDHQGYTARDRANERTPTVTFFSNEFTETVSIIDDYNTRRDESDRAKRAEKLEAQLLAEDLHRVAKHGDEEKVREILLGSRYKGDKINVINSKNETALHLAAAEGHFGVVRVLLRLDAASILSLDEGEFRVDTSLTDTEGFTAKARAHSLIPYGSSIGRTNKYTEVEDVIRDYDDRKEQKRKDEMTHRERAAEAQRFAKIESGPANEMLTYAIEKAIPGTCNLTMAEVALKKMDIEHASSGQHSDTHESDTRIEFLEQHQNLASKKSGSIYGRDVWANDCTKVRDKVDQAVQKFKQMRDQQILRAGDEQDEQRFPSAKLLREKLSDFVGIESFRKEMKEFLISDAYTRDIIEGQGGTMDCSHLVWTFTGRPGTGKTSIARLISPVLHEAGIIQANGTELFKEVKKFHVKGAVVGETEKKVEAIFGGDYRVIFMDEAYTYNIKDEYEKIVLEQLLQYVLDKTTCATRKVYIFAGYKLEMAKWERFNDGFASRIQQRFELPNLPPKIVAQITLNKLKNEKLVTLNADPVRYVEQLGKMIGRGTNETLRDVNGGRLAEHLVNLIIQEHVKGRPQREVAHIVEQSTVCQAMKRLNQRMNGNAPDEGDGPNGEGPVDFDSDQDCKKAAVLKHLPQRKETPRPNEQDHQPRQHGHSESQPADQQQEDTCDEGDTATAVNHADRTDAQTSRHVKSDEQMVRQAKAWEQLGQEAKQSREALQQLADAGVKSEKQAQQSRETLQQLVDVAVKHEEQTTPQAIVAGWWSFAETQLEAVKSHLAEIGIHRTIIDGAFEVVMNYGLSLLLGTGYLFLLWGVLRAAWWLFKWCASWAVWLMQKALKWVIKFFRKCCGKCCKQCCPGKQGVTKDEQTDSDEAKEDDDDLMINLPRPPAVCPYERARNKMKEQSDSDVAIDQAMNILWQSVPKDVATHEAQIRLSLRKYHSSYHKHPVVTSSTTPGTTVASSKTQRN